jgi:hypothetical protein
VKKSLATSSPRIKVFDVTEEDRAEDETTKSASESAIVVDWNIGGKR